MTWAPKCPRCGALDVRERTGEAETYEGPLSTTHECERCHAPFRVTPPEDVWLRELIAEVNA